MLVSLLNAAGYADRLWCTFSTSHKYFIINWSLPMILTRQIAHVSDITSQDHMATPFHFFTWNRGGPLPSAASPVADDGLVLLAADSDASALSDSISTWKSAKSPRCLDVTDNSRWVRAVHNHAVASDKGESKIYQEQFQRLRPGIVFVDSNSKIMLMSENLNYLSWTLFWGKTSTIRDL